MPNFKEELKKEALRIHEDTEYSYKAHFVLAEMWNRVNFWLGIPAIILSVIAGSVALTKIICNFEVYAGIAGFCAASLTALLTFMKPTVQYENHSKYGNQYLSLRNDLRRFYEIEVNTTKSDVELKEILDTLIAKKKDIDEKSPLLSNWAYNEAKKRIVKGETKYKVDKK